MSRSRRQRKFSGTQSADPFILPKGRSVIKGFDADDGDFIGLPSDAKFKLLKRKGGVLIKGKGFRTMVRGADVKTLEAAVALPKVDQVAEWKKYCDDTVRVQIYEDAKYRILDFMEYGQVNAPSSMYENWTNINISPMDGELSFLNDEIFLGEGDTKLKLNYVWADMGGVFDLPRIDAGSGDDILELVDFPETSSPLNPQNFENLNLRHTLDRDLDRVWLLTGEFPQMSVNIYSGGIQLTENTVLKNVRAFWGKDTHRNSDRKVPFVSAFRDDIIDFNKAFADEGDKLAIIPDWGKNDNAAHEGDFVLLSGKYKNASIEKLQSKDDLVSTEIDEEGGRIFMEYEKDNHDSTIGFYDTKSAGKDILVELTAIPADSLI